MEGSSKAKRRKFLIKKRFQFGFIARIIGLIILSGLSSGLILYLLIFSELGAQLWVAHLQIRNAWPVFGPALLTAYILAVAIACLAAAIIVLRTSNKIAGPLYRFERVCKEIAAGDYDVSAKIRETDQLRELADSFELMLDNLRGRQKEQHELLQQAVMITAELRNSTEQSPENQKLLHSLDEQLSRLAAKTGWKAAE